MITLGSSQSSTPSTPTTTTHVVIVGNGEEEDKGDPTRSTLGDEQVYRCFQRLPQTRIHFIKDEDCTKHNCEVQMERFLGTSSFVSPHDTLVFYYGGHGTKTRFKTPNKGGWRYADVCATIERCFVGDKIWYLIDCCHSGCFVNYISRSSKRRMCASCPPMATMEPTTNG